MKTNRSRVLIVQEEISLYNIPLFNRLAGYYDVSIIYSKGKAPIDTKFNTIFIPTVTFRHRWHKKSLRRIAKLFDIVICIANLSYVYSRLLYFRPRRYKLLYWGIGVAAGYDTRYDSDSSMVKKMAKAVKKADGIIFYSNYPVSKYIGEGVSQNKLYVANNTTEVYVPEDNDSNVEKNIFLFVGTLYEGKKIEVLLEAYKRVYAANRNIYPLVIIGNGKLEDEIRRWIDDNQLTEKILLKGAIYDETELYKYFLQALLCISPDQAGLSVLKAMGYGVPFVTHKNAITGGEIFNIIDKENGILLNSFDELEYVMNDAFVNPEKYLLMGKNALDYYKKNCTIDHMVKGFVDAIENTIIKGDKL